MKIDPIKVASLYEANSKKNSADNRNVKKDIQHSNDRVEISNSGSKHSEVASLNSKIIRGIEKGASAEKIQRLKAEIENGTYNISSSDITNAMLNSKEKNK